MNFPAWALQRIDQIAKSPSELRAVAEAVSSDAHPAEVEELAALLGQYLAGLVSWLGTVPALDAEQDGMLAIDAAAANYLDQCGTHGMKMAATLRGASRQRWAGRFSGSFLGVAGDLRLWSLWVPTGSQDRHSYALMLAEVLGMALSPSAPAVVAGAVATVPAPGGLEAGVVPTMPIGTKHPALSAVVLRRIIEAFLSGRPQATKVDGETRLLSRLGEVVAVVCADVANDSPRVRELSRATRSLLAHRFFRYVINAGAENHLLVKSHDHRVLTIEGGISGLAALLGVGKSKKSGHLLRLILDAFKFFKIALPNGETTALVNWTLDPANQGQRARLRVVLHDALLPGFVTGLPKGTPAQREARKLVPIPARLPPLVGSNKTYAAQALLQLLVLEELNAYAEDLYTSGVAPICWMRWLELGEEAGIDGELLEDVYSAWVYGPTRLLEKKPQDGDTYTLAAAYGAELQGIVNGGAKAARGRAYQAKSAKKWR